MCSRQGGAELNENGGKLKRGAASARLTQAQAYELHIKAYPNDKTVHTHSLKHVFTHTHTHSLYLSVTSMLSLSHTLSLSLPSLPILLQRF